MPRKVKKRGFNYIIGLVCEGETEHTYFSEFKEHNKMPFTLKPDLPQHSSHTSVFKKAKELVSQNKYDKVYCIFDLDVTKRNQSEKADYKKCISELPENKKIVAIENMPCFELWFLLHFSNYSAKIYSTWEELKPVLRTYWPNYVKNKTPNLYEYPTTHGNEEKAKESAEKLRTEKAKSNNDLFPFTDMDLLLEDLNRLKQSREDKDNNRKRKKHKKTKRHNLKLSCAFFVSKIVFIGFSKNAE